MARAEKPQRHGKPTSLRAMPVLCGFFPMYQDFSIRDTGQLSLDLSCVQRIDAVGINLFLSNLLHALGTHNFRDFRLIRPTDAHANEQMLILNVPAILARNRLDYHPELEFSRVANEAKRVRNISQCMLEVVNNGASERDAQLHSARTSLKAFFKENGGWSVNQSQLLLVLTEMIKNTLDHTEHDALLGIVIQFKDDVPSSIDFSYCEQGPGLSKTLREKVRGMPGLQARGAKASLADLIHWALKPGNSTKKGNGINYGVGLTMITEGARSLGMSLCMIDAQSLLSLDQLPADPAHATLRRAFSKVARQGCFTYTGSKIYD